MRRLLCALLCLCATVSAYAFADDLCYDKETHRTFNCVQKHDACYPLNESRACKTQLAVHVADALNRQKSMRSMVHLDSTFYLAQAVGFPYDDAHTIAVYDQNIDIGQYIPTNWQGNPIVSPEACETANPPGNCRYLPKPMNAVLRLNAQAGGTFFHYGAPLDPQTKPDGLNPPLHGSDSEVFLRNLHNWIYNDQIVCTAGLTEDHQCKRKTQAEPSRLLGYFPIFEDNDQNDFPINIEVSHQLIHQDETHTVYSDQLDSWVGQANAQHTKMGVYLHVLQDRISHHGCIDEAKIADPDKNPNRNHVVTYERATCHQGIHLLWHSWETGQPQYLVPPYHQTVRAGLEKTYDALVEYAEYRKTLHPRAKDPAHKNLVIDGMMHALQIEHPDERLNRMIYNMRSLGYEPMPGYK